MKKKYLLLGLSLLAGCAGGTESSNTSSINPGSSVNSLPFVASSSINGFEGSETLSSNSNSDSVSSVMEPFTENLMYEMNEKGDGYIVAGIGTASDTEIIIPSMHEGLPVLGVKSYAFAENATITSVQIPQGVTTIGNAVFYNCKALTAVEIPDSVTSIGEDVFSRCKSLRYNEYGDCYYLGNEENPYRVLIRARDTSVTYVSIPDTTGLILNAAFKNCTSLTSVRIPNGVTSIEKDTFAACSALTWLSIPDSVTKLDFSALTGCDSLQYTEYENAYYLGSDGNPYLILIKAKDTSITEMIVPDSTRFIMDLAFYNCKSLRLVTIPNGLVSIGTSAFGFCNVLGSIKIPDSVISIGNGAFDFCYSLEYTEYEDCYYLGNETNPYLVFVDTKTDSIATATIPNGTRFIMDSAFNSCRSLTSVEIPDSVTSIGASAFRYCSNLLSVTIPGNVTKIDRFAFDGCNSLTSLTVPKGITSIETYSFSKCGQLTSVAFEDGSELMSIGGYAFSECRSLTSLEIPKSVTNIGDRAFDGCYNLQYNEYENCNYLGNEENPYLVLVTAKATYLITDITTSISNTTRFIMNDAFRACKYITSTSIVIPNSVASIGTNAFYYCDTLTSVTIPNSVITIGSYSFGDCHQLTSVTFEDGSEISTISNGCFTDCSSLVSITIPNSVVSIEGAFNFCTSLTSIVIPSSVKFIEDAAFYGCDSLTIYCEASSQPSEWDPLWNCSYMDDNGYTYLPVYWGGGW